MHKAQKNWSSKIVFWFIEFFRISRRRACVCVSFFNSPPGNKWQETVTTSTYQYQLNAACEVYEVHGIPSLKYIYDFYTPVCYWKDIYFIFSCP